MRSAVLIAIALMAGCRSCPDIKVPELVRVPVPTMVPVPAELTEPCAQVAKRDNTVGEAVRLANARKAALEECSKRMSQIRSLGTEVKP
ncbi:Rz1-like lysis system protein LysC [Marilutibacter spongiae]|uniref:Uncharacterized protein n=1 Tax=Marilutibacter spongiae TaxID=2025720 RepID=A0A7W3TLJ3_9GAMM|nr:hypothetical protein [Lysobacter spongiae]MBB1060411.1 hypothetical protein [Lysobacter spongiae]